MTLFGNQLPIVSKEDLETILMLRADKWRGINNDVSDYYSVLLTELPNDIEKRAEEWRVIYAKRQEREDLKKKYGISISAYVWDKLLSAEAVSLKEIERAYVDSLEQLVKGWGEQGICGMTDFRFKDSILWAASSLVHFVLKTDAPG